jgi:hypothetical protein
MTMQAIETKMTRAILSPGSWRYQCLAFRNLRNCAFISIRGTAASFRPSNRPPSFGHLSGVPQHDGHRWDLVCMFSRSYSYELNCCADCSQV